MPVDPIKTVQAARDKGDPELAEWLQVEVDRWNREKRMGRVKAALVNFGLWALIFGFLWWIFG